MTAAPVGREAQRQMEVHVKVVVTATGEGLDAQVDPRFGRAAAFVVVDLESGESFSIDNAAGVSAMGGAGVQAAEKVSRLGAGALITGHCGPNAFRTLNAAGVEIYIGANGTVAEAVEAFENGQLSKAGAPDVGGHWM